MFIYPLLSHGTPTRHDLLVSTLYDGALVVFVDGSLFDAVAVHEAAWAQGMVGRHLRDGGALGAFEMAMVHGDGQVVPFFLWNGVVGDACGDVGDF